MKPCNHMKLEKVMNWGKLHIVGTFGRIEV